MSELEPDLDAVPAEPGEALEVAQVRVLAPVARPETLPAVQAAAVGAAGFVAGAAALALVRRRSTRRLVRRRRKARRATDLLPVVASRSFLVDVHLIGRE